jgi:hypothetical protein
MAPFSSHSGCSSRRKRCSGEPNNPLFKPPQARSRTKPSNAPQSKLDQETFLVTHPFHPLYKERFGLVERRRNWREDRVCYYDQKGRLCSLPASWTSVSEPDPILTIAAGRSFFCTDDLLKLSRLIEEISQEEEGVKSKL